MTWAQLQQDFELFMSRGRYICAMAVPAFYAVNEIWSFFDASTANKIVGTFVALGFLTQVRGTLYTPVPDQLVRPFANLGEEKPKQI
jgi:hypothetical protein